jgi:GWxTD domain-containing protein
MKLRITCILGMIVLLGGCGTLSRQTESAEPSPEYLASLYNPSELSLHPDYTLFHENDRFSMLYIRAYPAELRFSATNEDAEYRALLGIHYRLIELDPAGMEGTVVDSASVTYKLLEKDEKRPAFIASRSVPIRSGYRYLLRLEAQDVQRGSVGLEYLYVDKTNPYGAQNFKVVSFASGYPKFMSFFMPGEDFSIHYRNPSVDSIHVDYFRLESELPRPPVTATADYTISHTSDTSFVYPLSDTVHFDLVRVGMFFFRVDPEKEEGLTLFNFGGSFPEVKTPTELMEPIFYLATLAEYRDLRREPNRKLAVDNFWLQRGNSVERSRELIRVYYNRVVYSNLYFTSNKEGWKTDRGMIFILFGPPSRIRMTGRGERWYYFTNRRNKTVEFRFDRQPDVHSYDHMKWMKTSESQVLWNEAVRSWRNGKVYSPVS